MPLAVGRLRFVQVTHCVGVVICGFSYCTTQFCSPITFGAVGTFMGVCDTGVGVVTHCETLVGVETGKGVFVGAQKVILLVPCVFVASVLVT